MRSGGRRWSTIGLLALLLAFLPAAAHHVPVAGAAGLSPALRQKSTMTAGTGTGTVTVSPTLPSASVAGTLLVAVLLTNGNSPNSTPAGWTRAASASVTADLAQIWYEAANPGGVTTVSFGARSGTLMSAQLTEWTGASTTSPIDVTGTATAASAATRLTVATSSATNANSETAISAFVQSTVLGVRLSPGSGWTNLGSQAAATGLLIATGSDTLSSIAAATTVSETETSSGSGTWAGAVVTVEPPCGGGALSLSGPSTMSFGTATLTGSDQTLSTSVNLQVSDLTSSGAGWSVTIAATTFTSSRGNPIPASDASITAATSITGGSTCVAPSNQVTYPATLGSAPVKVFDAIVGTGSGAMTVALTSRLVVPAMSYAASYTSTWTVTLGSGP